MMKIMANEISNMLATTRKIPVRKMAEQKGMLIGSCNLKDGTSLKMIADDSQLNAVIMKDGNVLSAKGIFGSVKKISRTIQDIFFKLTGKNKLQDRKSEENLFKFVNKYDFDYIAKPMD